MCEFCKSICKLKRIENEHFKGYFPEENKTQIVKDKYGKFHIWFDGFGDCFQCGIDIEDINFCPICGRKLKEE